MYTDDGVTATSFQYRQIREDDFEAIKAVHLKLFPIQYSDDFLSAACRGVGLNGGSLFSVIVSLPDDDSHIVGFILAQLLPRTSCDERDVLDPQSLGIKTCYILTLGITKAYRRCGLGNILLRECVRYAQTCPECAMVYLHVIHYNLPGIYFYEKNGFLCVKEIADFYSIGKEYHRAYVYAYFINDNYPTLYLRIYGSVRTHGLTILDFVGKWLLGSIFPTLLEPVVEEYMDSRGHDSDDQKRTEKSFANAIESLEPNGRQGLKWRFFLLLLRIEFFFETMWQCKARQAVIRVMKCLIPRRDPLDKSAFHDTSTATYISRSAHLYNTPSIEFPSGNCIIDTGVVIRGDLGAVRIERYCVIHKGSILRPSYVMNPGFRFIPLHIGNYSIVGENCVIECAVMGVGCTIGDNSIISKRAILRDYVTVLPNTIVPPDMVIPPFSIVGGCPAKLLSENPESITTMKPIEAKELFRYLTKT